METQEKITESTVTTPCQCKETSTARKIGNLLVGLSVLYGIIYFAGSAWKNSQK